MDPLQRWDDWEWERAAQELGRSKKHNAYERDSRGKKYYFTEEPVRSFADKWTGSQKRVMLSALLLLCIVFSSRGDDFFSQNIYAFYKMGMDSGNIYASLNTMAKEVIGITGNESLAVNAPVQEIFYPPVAGTVRVGFHGKSFTGSLSDGIEIESALGTPVLCPREGVVMEVAEHALWGNMVRLNLGDGWEGIIANLGEVNVRRGDPLSQKAQVGTVGLSSGRQKPWLYFELRHNGKAVNPLNYLIQAENKNPN